MRTLCAKQRSLAGSVGAARDDAFGSRTCTENVPLSEHKGAGWCGKSVAVRWEASTAGNVEGESQFQTVSMREETLAAKKARSESASVAADIASIIAMRSAREEAPKTGTGKKKNNTKWGRAGMFRHQAALTLASTSDDRPRCRASASRFNLSITLCQHGARNRKPSRTADGAEHARLGR
ncbi:hypothetical protein L1887_60208 [Cichorium endivia]|nr:hypothetical protein L1887_60208 [Cichorium endivia]